MSANGFEAESESREGGQGERNPINNPRELDRQDDDDDARALLTLSLIHQKKAQVFEGWFFLILIFLFKLQFDSF